MRRSRRIAHIGEPEPSLVWQIDGLFKPFAHTPSLSSTTGLSAGPGSGDRPRSLWARCVVRSRRDRPIACAMPRLLRPTHHSCRVIRSVRFALSVLAEFSQEPNARPSRQR